MICLKEVNTILKADTLEVFIQKIKAEKHKDI